jgi:hypothetical protein
MRAFIQKLIAICSDRLTVHERWLVLAFLGIVVLGSLVKYSRARPVPETAHPRATEPAQPTLDHRHEFPTHF